MSRLLVTIPVTGCLVLAIAATAPGVVADVAAGRQTWRTAYELRRATPHCWSLPLLAYCRVDWEETVGGRIEQTSAHYLLSEPLRDRVTLVRSDRLWGHVTAIAALDRLRERAAIVMILVALLGLGVWRSLVVGARRLLTEEDVATRMAAAGWRVETATSEATRQTTRRGLSRPQFGHRH